MLRAVRGETVLLGTLGSTVTWYFGGGGRRFECKTVLVLKVRVVEFLRIGDRAVVIGDGLWERTRRRRYVGEEADEGMRSEVAVVATAGAHSTSVVPSEDAVKTRSKGRGSCSFSSIFSLVTLVLTRRGRVRTLSRIGLRMAIRLWRPSIAVLVTDVGVVNVC